MIDGRAPTSKACELVFDGLMRRIDQQARVVEVVASQAEALSSATSDFDADGLLSSTPSEEAAELLSVSTTAHADLLATAKRLQGRQRELATWLQRVASEAREQQEHVSRERRALVEQTRAILAQSHSLEVLNAELHALQLSSEAKLQALEEQCSQQPQTKAPTGSQGPPGKAPATPAAPAPAAPAALATSTIAVFAAAPPPGGSTPTAPAPDAPAAAPPALSVSTSTVSVASASSSSVETTAAPSRSSSSAALRTSVGAARASQPSQVIRLNVGGEIFCTTRQVTSLEQSRNSHIAAVCDSRV